MKWILVLALVLSGLPKMAVAQTVSEDTSAPDMTYLTEEEKVARDVYQAFAKKYSKRVFENIARSEQHHLEKMSDLLTTCDKDIPRAVRKDKPGRFDSPELQELYQSLVARGEKSLEDALRVGALIEETDILDLRAAAAGAECEEATQLYVRLEKASYNHLRAFVRNLDKQGVTYEPVLLAQEDYTDILSQEKFRGEGHGKGNGHSGGKGHGKNQHKKHGG